MPSGACLENGIALEELRLAGLALQLVRRETGKE